MAFEALAEAAERWCARTPFQLIAAEETERRMDFYAEPGVSFYVLCPEAACGDSFVSAREQGVGDTRACARTGGQPCTAASRSPLRPRRSPGLGGAPEGTAGRGGGAAEGCGAGGRRGRGLRRRPACGPGRRGQGGGVLPGAHHGLQNGVRCRWGRPHGQGCGQRHPRPPPTPPPSPSPRFGQAAGSGAARGVRVPGHPAPLLLRPAGAAAAAPRAAPSILPGSRGTAQGRAGWQGCHGKWRMGRDKMESR